jgi:hypothetical protein
MEPQMNADERKLCGVRGRSLRRAAHPGGHDLSLFAFIRVHPRFHISFAPAAPDA